MNFVRDWEDRPEEKWILHSILIPKNLPPIIGSGVRLILFCNKGLRRPLLLNRSRLPPKLGSEGLLPFVVGGGGCKTFRFRIFCVEEDWEDEGAMTNTGESCCCCCCCCWYWWWGWAGGAEGGPPGCKIILSCCSPPSWNPRAMMICLPFPAAPKSPLRKLGLAIRFIAASDGNCLSALLFVILLCLLH